MRGDQMIAYSHELYTLYTQAQCDSPPPSQRMGPTTVQLELLCLDGTQTMGSRGGGGRLREIGTEGDRGAAA